MPKKKRPSRPQPEPAPEPIAKIKKRRRRRKPVIVMAEPKTLMQRIFEAQRTELDRLNEALRTKVFESLDF
jgi:endonuclease V-like protein UPF0215 family